MDIKRISLLSVVGILLLTMIGCGGKYKNYLWISNEFHFFRWSAYCC